MTMKSPDKRLIVVLGMHRSGTSAAVRTLNILGAELGSDLIGPDGNNVNGYWEHAQAVAINEKLLFSLGRAWSDVRELPQGWMQTDAARQAAADIEALIKRELVAGTVFVLKDPRMCLTLPVWNEAFRRQQIAPLFLIVIRNPWEVARSLARRDHLGSEIAASLWLRHVITVERYTRQCTRALLRYEDLISDWRSSMRQVMETFGIDFAQADDPSMRERLDAFLSPRERHHVALARRHPFLKYFDVRAAAEDAYHILPGVISGKFGANRLHKYDVTLTRFLRRLDVVSLSLIDSLQSSQEIEFRRRGSFLMHTNELQSSYKSLEDTAKKAEELALSRLHEVSELSARVKTTQLALATAETLALSRYADLQATTKQLADAYDAIGYAELVVAEKDRLLSEVNKALKTAIEAKDNAEALAYARLSELEQIRERDEGLAHADKPASEQRPR